MRWTTNLCFGIGCSLLLVGCQLAGPPPSPSPFSHRLVREPLVLHSDFPLPASHRLIDDLLAARERLSKTLLLPTTEEPIHVYLFSEAAEYYELVEQRYPKLAGRRAIFVETDVELAIYAHWGDHLAEDLRHEVTHGYLHAAIPNMPLWLDEGLAEYFEVGRGQQGLHREHLDHLLGQIEIARWQPKLERLEQLMNASEMTQQNYAEAWAWVYFLLESGGDKQTLLTDYLADLRNGAAGAMLSLRVQKRLANPELALVEHLQSL